MEQSLEMVSESSTFPAVTAREWELAPSFSLAVSAQWQATGPPLSSTAPSSDTNRHW